MEGQEGQGGRGGGAALIVKNEEAWKHITTSPVSLSALGTVEFQFGAACTLL